jgi:hypothetical protein
VEVARRLHLLRERHNVGRRRQIPAADTRDKT